MESRALSAEILDLVHSRQSRKRPQSVALLSSSESEEAHDGYDDNYNDDDGNDAVSVEGYEQRQKAIFGSDNSEDEGEEEKDHFSDGLDADLMGDEEDRKRLAAMTEMEREALLYERAQRREAISERRALQKRLKERTAAANSKRPTRAASSSAEIKRKSLKELKARREKKRVAESDSDWGSEPEDGQLLERNQSASKSQRSPSPGRRPVKEAVDRLSFDQANRLRISRDTILSWMYRPGFDEILRGSLMRVSLGVDPETGSSVYRLTEVRKVVPASKPYTVAKSMIDKAVSLRIGKSERNVRFDVISNSEFTDRDFQRWTTELEHAKISIPSAEWADKKIAELKEFDARPLGEDAILHMIETKRRLGRRHRNYAAEKAALLSQREEAQASGNIDEVWRIDNELSIIAAETEERSTNDSRLEAFAEINKRNRRLNLAVRHDKHIHADNYDASLDPFSRRRCMPSIIHASMSIDKSSDAAKIIPQSIPAVEIVDSLATSLAGTSSSTPPGSPGSRATSPPKDLFEAHDFDIDIDL